MKTTPFDELVYTAARLHDKHPVFQNFVEMLKTVPINAVLFDDTLTEHAALPEAAANLWKLGDNFCLFAEQGLLPGHYTSLATFAAEGEELGKWDLVGLLVFKHPGEAKGFDVIPLMRSPETRNLVLPELQLSFTWGGKGWVWRPATTGFVNAFVFGGMLRKLEKQPAPASYEEHLEILGNTIIRYLGDFSALLDKPGTWKTFEPKESRCKKNEKGDVVKLYEIAHMGYNVYEVTA